jgi:queuine tRNA-ribosyltransferase
MGFPGYAIGGLSVGETKSEMAEMIEVVNAILPANKPRYLMGVGAPEDLVNGIQRGIDIFDCVLPTRLARHQAAMTRLGRLNLLNASFAHDARPIEDGCTCYTCRNYTRAYLRHLVVAKEMLAATLVSMHNLFFLLELTRQARQAIQESRYQQFAEEWLAVLDATE